MVGMGDEVVAIGDAEQEAAVGDTDHAGWGFFNRSGAPGGADAPCGASRDGDNALVEEFAVFKCLDDYFALVRAEVIV